MPISLITATQLDASLLAAWRSLQACHPALQSPYYCPEFTLAVAAVRKDVRIAVIEDSNRVVGFLPFQARWGMGRPVGGSLSDHHGVICAPDTRWSWPGLLKATRLDSWRFDHLPRAQAPADPSVTPCESPGLDLSRGMATYLAGRRAHGVRRLGELERKARKLAREVGPLRLEAHTRDPQVLETVMRLKSLQCRRTGVPDCFAQPWARALAEGICAWQAPQFSGRLSALYAGEHLVGAHLGMRSAQVWHWWFPVYDAGYAPYSPGGQLLLQVAQAAADQGHALLDLGKGDDPYKQSFADCSLPLAEGWVARPSVTSAWLQACTEMRQWLQTSPLVQPLRPLVRRWRRARVQAGVDQA
ncbi:MAG: hypothetical protein RL522_114 [Pseudomonadota bacterium]|jgi:CelD/BcsL family acetyltransferase involved in cellulose biosynthesis